MSLEADCALSQRPDKSSPAGLPVATFAQMPAWMQALCGKCITSCSGTGRASWQHLSGDSQGCIFAVLRSANRLSDAGGHCNVRAVLQKRDDHIYTSTFAGYLDMRLSTTRQLVR